MLISLSWRDGTLVHTAPNYYSISKFQSELTLTDSNQCIVEVNERVTYVFTSSTRKILRTIPTDLPYGYARMIEEIQVTPMSADDPSIQVSDVSYLPSGDGMKQIHVSLEHSTSSNETVTLQYKYKMNGPLFVFHKESKVS